MLQKIIEKIFLKFFYKVLIIDINFNIIKNQNFNTENIKFIRNNIDLLSIKLNKITYFNIGEESIKVLKINLNNIDYIIFVKINEDIDKHTFNNDNIDLLTKLYNRKGLIKKFNKLKENLSNYNIIIIDIKNFKNVNKIKTFKYGDLILKSLGKKLKEFTDNNSIISRISIDVFILVINKKETKLLKKIKSLLENFNNDEEIFFNIGIIDNLKNNESFEEVLRKLEITLEVSKLKNEYFKNTYTYFNNELLQKSEKFFNQKLLIDEALQKKQFFYLYQPIVDHNKKIIGLETLLRIKKKNTIITPSLFINYLEETKLIKKVDMLLIEDLKKTLSKLEKTNIILSLNFSAPTIEDEEIINLILNDYEKFKKNIKIEITERLFVNKHLINNTKLKDFEIAIDDFGTGYSSLKYLAEIPAKYLKLDISFVSQLLNYENTNYYLIIKTIINFAKELGLKVIAEGVETKEQFYELKKLGCDYFQGYYFYTPMDFKDIEVILKEQGDL